MQKKLSSAEANLKEEREASKIYQFNIGELNKNIEDLKVKHRIEIEAIKAEANLSPDVVVDEISEAEADANHMMTTSQKELRCLSGIEQSFKSRFSLNMQKCSAIKENFATSF